MLPSVIVYSCSGISISKIEFSFLLTFEALSFVSLNRISLLPNLEFLWACFFVLFIFAIFQ